MTELRTTGLDFQYDSTPKPGAHKGSMRKVAKKLMCTSALSPECIV